MPWVYERRQTYAVRGEVRRDARGQWRCERHNLVIMLRYETGWPVIMGDEDGKD